MLIAGALFAALSALLGFWGALIEIDYGPWWAGGEPPAELSKRRRQRVLNQCAAACAAVSAALQLATLAM